MAQSDAPQPSESRRLYSTPRLVHYGHVTHVTHGFAGSGSDYAGSYYSSDRNVKRDILPVVW
jgi:hypothetical protein